MTQGTAYKAAPGELPKRQLRTREEDNTPPSQSVLIKPALRQNTQRWQRAKPSMRREVVMPHTVRGKACGEPRGLQNRILRDKT